MSSKCNPENYFLKTFFKLKLKSTFPMQCNARYISLFVPAFTVGVLRPWAQWSNSLREVAWELVARGPCPLCTYFWRGANDPKGCQINKKMTYKKLYYTTSSPGPRRRGFCSKLGNVSAAAEVQNPRHILESPRM